MPWAFFSGLLVHCFSCCCLSTSPTHLLTCYHTLGHEHEPILRSGAWPITALGIFQPMQMKPRDLGPTHGCNEYPALYHIRVGASTAKPIDIWWRCPMTSYVMQGIEFRWGILHSPTLKIFFLSINLQLNSLLGSKGLYNLGGNLGGTVFKVYPFSLNYRLFSIKSRKTEIICDFKMSSRCALACWKSPLHVQKLIWFWSVAL